MDRHLPRLFLLFGIPIGTLFAFLMPPGQIADETMHFARAYSVSRGACVATPDIDMPRSFVKLNERFPDRLEMHFKVSMADFRQAAADSLNDQELAGNGTERSLSGFINQNVYHCAPYLPEAAVLYAGRHAALPPLILLYLCRMTNLAFYVLATYAALRLLPDFRAVLFCVALMPMTLHQAASISADATILAVSFLYTAYVFRLALGKDPERLGIREHVCLILPILFLAVSKTLVSAVFLLLLIPGRKFPTRWSRWLTMGAYLVLAMAGAGLWQHVNEPNLHRLAEQRFRMSIDVVANLRFMREHPFELVLIFLRCVADLKFFYYNFLGFVGTLGWLAIQLPVWLVWLYFVLLATAAVTQARVTRFSPVSRGILLLFVAAVVANTLAAGWAINVPKIMVDEPLLWSDIRVPLQGRYFIPFAAPILILFSTGRTRFNPRYFLLFAAATIVLANAVSFYMIQKTYYL